ncbi:hypothetical protein CRG98_003255 [Punica granatum]|uniref:Reverse transcriptase domain-containing protein n=1 Tax=Punica granatum TaxID=22663 RepID=A0A2I0L6R8_PUNGR|nr:hypothetical protein CRG98_003255 [Punica granatum]
MAEFKELLDEAGLEDHSWTGYYYTWTNKRAEGFIAHGRRIGDNILLAHELVKGCKKEGVSHRCAVKADIMKAFDSVSWSFLLNIFHAIGLPEQFTSWIFECITGPRYSVVINGGMEGYFRGMKGLRQRDPLSPYLFVVAIEVLSRLFEAAAQDGRISSQPFCKKLNITHLGFADNLLIFLKGDDGSLRAIMDIFEVFYGMSGLRLNPKKTEIYCAGLGSSTVQELLLISGFKRGSLLVK